MKDPANNWVGAYYGIIALTTNTSVVKNAPKTFADLKKPEYKGKVALNDDPRKAGAAFAGVMAASLANGGSADDIMPGIQYFADLKKLGNFVPANVTDQTILSGETPIAIDWSYNMPGLLEKMKAQGLTGETDFPSDGVYGGYYAQGVVKESPHPNCAKLWMEHILSDEGALGYLKGGAMPARFAGARKATRSPPRHEEPAPGRSHRSGEVPDADQITKANQALTDNWDKMVLQA